MKTELLRYTSWLSIFVFSAISCVKYEAEPKTEITHCYEVFDVETNQPIEDVLVSITHEEYTHSNHFFYNYKKARTDSDGKVCFNLKAKDNIIHILTLHEDYAYNCKYSVLLTHVINLEPVAYIKLHIKNIEPTDSSDMISVSYPQFCGSYSSFFYRYSDYGPPCGVFLDTTIISKLSPGTYPIYYRTYHKGKRDTITTEHVTFTSHDTISYKILY